MNQDETHMRRALRQAQRGRGRVSPNPLVGAVVARGHQVVGQGAHLQVGGPHAEVHALAQAGDQARGATLYVTLEPCAHQGRTPPCCPALIDAGIERVVCAVEDPDPRVRGAGLLQLKNAGIQVDVGVLQVPAERQNAAYLKHRRTGLPLVVLKLAQTLDGRIATRSGDSRWITGVEARTFVHRWRSWVDGVMVGAGTIAADDPQLNVRHVKGADPRPMIVDGGLQVSPEARVFQQPGAILITADSSPSALAPFTARGVEIWTFQAPAGRIDLRQPLAAAGQQGMTSIMIEGGSELAAAALRDRVVDQVMFFVAPRLLGQGVASIGDLDIARVEDAINLEDLRTRRLGRDLLYTAEVRYPCSPD